MTELASTAEPNMNNSEELIFGLVAPLGTNLEFAAKALGQILEKFGYRLTTISLSGFLHSRSSQWKGEVSNHRDRYIEQHQEAGNALRRALGRRDALAAAAALLIREDREARRESAEYTRRAFVIRQLKLPEEVHLLRMIYGERFVLLGLYTPFEQRKKALAREIAETHGEGVSWTKYESRAKDLITVDQTENDEFGQNVQDTFPLADVFLSVSATAGQVSSGDTKFEDALGRFISLLFGKPDETPTTEEFLMFQAKAVALRSGDLSRQVGAVIATRSGSIIAVGQNDDPAVGGGVAPVSIRHTKDRSEEPKRQLLGEALDRLTDVLQPKFAARDRGIRIGDALKLLSGSRLLGLSDLSRMVHAEMAALIDAAMRGVAVCDQVMFSTTFPCQNCAKHIMAAGIRAVAHMEPYPKSLVEDMYEGEVEIGPMVQLCELDHFAPATATSTRQGSAPNRLLVCTYLGVAPRRYGQLFAMPVRRGADRHLASWEARTASLRPEVATTSLDYIQREKDAPVFLDLLLRDRHNEQDHK
jgi:cytidine deaminase